MIAPIAVDETGAITCARLRPAVEAAGGLTAFANAMEERMRRSEAGRSLNNKAPEHALRLAAVLQMYDAVAENDAPPPSSCPPRAVDAEHMRRGIALAEFFVAEAERLMGHGEVDPETSDAAAIERWLLEKGKTVVTMVELSQYGPGGMRSVRKLRAATRVLVETAACACARTGPFLKAQAARGMGCRARRSRLKRPARRRRPAPARPAIPKFSKALARPLAA